MKKQLLTAPVYFVDETTEPGKRMIQLAYSPADRFKALNFTGYTWPDVKYGVVKAAIKNHRVIVTDSDLIAHEDYIPQIEWRTVVLIHRPEGKASANVARLRRAEAALKAAGKRVKYFADWGAMERFVERELERGKPKWE